ncbi:hypothetical protein ACT7CZ_30600 [Bacillus cereus]
MRKQLHFMGWMFSFIPLDALDEKRLIASFEEWYIKIKGGLHVHLS